MISTKPQKIYTKDKEDFLRMLSYLDGRVFWRDKHENASKVEIKLAFPSKSTRKIVESLKD